jgi:hypothetical protein
MSGEPIVLHVGDAPETEAFLAERIYEFNSNATGYFDGEYFSGMQRDESGAVRAGIYGYTWEVAAISVTSGSTRPSGDTDWDVRFFWQPKNTPGSELLPCLRSHSSFQAPGFYHAWATRSNPSSRDHPVGHAVRSTQNARNAMRPSSRSLFALQKPAGVYSS